MKKQGLLTWNRDKNTENGQEYFPFIPGQEKANPPNDHVIAKATKD